MRPHTPEELPDLRLHLMDRWNSPTWLAMAMLQNFGGVIEMEKMAPVGSSGAHEAEAQRRHLLQSDLWWITEDMAQLLYATMPTIPDDVQLDDLPDEYRTRPGLAFLARRWHSPDATMRGQTVGVDAVMWTPALIDGRECLSLVTYKLVVGDVWHPLGRSEWVRGESLATVFPIRTDEYADTFAASSVDDHRLLAALFTLLSSPALSASVREGVSRPVRRRSERAGVRVNDVVVVRLRALPHPTREGNQDGEHHAVDWSHRWVVRAHPAYVRCGQGRLQRRLVMRGPFIKGPAEKPLRLKHTVNAWVR